MSGNATISGHIGIKVVQIIYPSLQMCVLNLNFCFRHLAYRQIFLQICICQGSVSNNMLHFTEKSTLNNDNKVSEESWHILLTFDCDLHWIQDSVDQLVY